MDERTTRWVELPQFPKYLISDDGRIVSLWWRKPRELRLYPTAAGYLRVVLKDDTGTQRRVLVNRLVCEAFHGPPPSPAHQAAHENGHNQENYADNLSWKTPKENDLDKIRHGSRRGRIPGTPVRETTRAAIGRALKGRPKSAEHRTKMLEGIRRVRAEGRPPRAARFSDVQIREIRQRRAETGATLRALAAEFGTSPGHISEICQGITCQPLAD
jgi:hypothetical protein